jgi:hypothetical protein
MTARDSDTEGRATAPAEMISAGKRSILVSASGILLLIVPYLALLGILIAATPESPIGTAIRDGHFSASFLAR